MSQCAVDVSESQRKRKTFFARWNSLAAIYFNKADIFELGRWLWFLSPAIISVHRTCLIENKRKVALDGGEFRNRFHFYLFASKGQKLFEINFGGNRSNL